MCCVPVLLFGQNKLDMRRLIYIPIGLVGLLAVTCVVTKPSELEHRAAALEQLKAYVRRNAESNIARDVPIISTVLGSAASMYSASLAEMVAREVVVVEQGICSNRAYLRVDGREIEISLGVLGQVYPSKTFQRELNEAIGVSSLFELIGVRDVMNDPS